MSLLRPGLLIAVEGIDGAGKTTQAHRLVEAFRRAGYVARYEKEPTQGPHGQRLRASAQAGRLSPREELDLFLADRRQHVDEVLRPCREAGEVIVVDRYYPSTVAYQGARGFDVDELVALNEAFAPVPDLLVILDLPPSTGLDRVRARGDRPDHFEDVDALTASRAIFQRFGGDHVLHVDATRGVDAVTETILQALRDGPLRARLGDAARRFPEPS